MTNPYLDQVNVNLRMLGHFELVNWVNQFAGALKVHPDYQEPFPKTVPDSAELTDGATTHFGLATAAQSGDHGKIRERDQFRPHLEANATITINWAMARAYRENNPRLISDLCLEPKRSGMQRNYSHPLVDAPSNLMIKHGPLPRSVYASTNKVAGSATYELWATQGDPTIQENWALVGQSPGCKKIEAYDLEAPKVWHFRVRCFGHAGYGPWSPIVTLTVI